METNCRSRSHSRNLLDSIKKYIYTTRVLSNPETNYQRKLVAAIIHNLNKLQGIGPNRDQTTNPESSNPSTNGA